MRIEFVLVRNGRGGANHIAYPRPDRRGRYTLACWRTLAPGSDGLVQERPREVRRALAHEWVCADCLELSELRGEAFLRATGWPRPARA